MPEKRTRTPIPPELADEVLFDADMTCCKCNEPGKPVQIHHINEDPSDNTKANLSVLCLHCHELTQLRGGFGRKLSAGIVIKYRDNWNHRVVARRAKVASLMPTPQSAIDLEGLPEKERRLLAFVSAIPGYIQSAHNLVQPQFDTGVTSEVMDGCYTVIDSMKTILLRLSRFYDPRQFDGAPEAFFSDLIASRFRWHRAHLEPEGPGTGGTIIGPLAASAVMGDVQSMVDDMVSTLTRDLPGFGAGTAIIPPLNLLTETETNNMGDDAQTFHDSTDPQSPIER